MRTARALALAAVVVGSAGLVAAPGGCSSTSARPAGDAELDRAVTWMTGSFSSSAQAEADPEFRTVVLHIVPIWLERTTAPGARWLYVEQALAETPEAPYRQRVYRVARDADGAIRSDVYLLPAPALDHAGAWREPAPLDGLDPSSLELRDGCAVVLRADGPRRFVGSTVGDGCASDLRGASYATSEVELTADALRSWDRGFASDGTQVWGARTGPYEFRRSVAP